MTETTRVRTAKQRSFWRAGAGRGPDGLLNLGDRQALGTR
jgi:hypothetical protein